jgi:hypothetical protein
MDRFAVGWHARGVLLRLVLGALLTAALGGCSAARVVDCAPGRFVRAGGDGWCLYAPRDTARCPRLLPVAHDLPWGGRGCAAEEHDPLPAELCVAAGECQPDAGAGGDAG